MPKNYLQNKKLKFQHVGLILKLKNATQSLMLVDNIGVIGPHSLFWEKKEIPCFNL